MGMGSFDEDEQDLLEAGDIDTDGIDDRADYEGEIIYRNNSMEDLMETFEDVKEAKG